MPEPFSLAFLCGMREYAKCDVELVMCTVLRILYKGYYETQNYFESRVRPGVPLISRIHATPGYPFGMTVGPTFRSWWK